MKHPSKTHTRAAELVTCFDAFTRRFMVRGNDVRRERVPLTRRELRALGAVGEQTAWKMGELARHLMLGMSSLTAVLDRLVAKHLVVRGRSHEDRRVVWVRLTAPGRRRYERFRRRRFRKACGMLSALNGEEQDTFIALMRTIGRGGQQTQEMP